MVFGKRQILLATLVLALGVAIYLNWQFSQSGKDLTLTDDVDASKNYGEAQFVDKEENQPADAVDATDVADKGITNPTGMIEAAMTNEAGEDYFIEARLNKKQSRDKAVETLQDILKDSKVSEEEKNIAIATAASLSDAIDAESNIESLIKAKGFKDCIAFIDGEKASIVVKTDGLLNSEAAQIKDIVLKECKVKAENITIIPVK
ncbi:SpoIIIAH-like family protein [Acetanaerobacterium elongatum]|uniref:Stage III sporulation protein AH n=1 Tax=Acetanaerobacterium elongatum TaxID=258515 RepID=A0A1H0AQM2_9FIRM|nr:SpoIIIAH-like family protein [Acetanaerobacterium elongatum]SDN35852.1 stage III sporulation protein AH [Acetanaerobacterium elongatum]